MGPMFGLKAKRCGYKSVYFVTNSTRDKTFFYINFETNKDQESDSQR